MSILHLILSGSGSHDGSSFVGRRTAVDRCAVVDGNGSSFQQRSSVPVHLQAELVLRVLLTHQLVHTGDIDELVAGEGL